MRINDWRQKELCLKINGWKQEGVGLLHNTYYSYEKKFGDKTLIIRVERHYGLCDIRVKGEPTAMISNIASLEEAMNFCEVRFGGQ